MTTSPRVSSCEPIALVVGGDGAGQLREALACVPLPPSRIWCAARDVEERAAAAGLATVIAVEPWPGASAALERLAALTEHARGASPVLVLGSRIRLRRRAIERALRRLRNGDSIILGTTSRLDALRLRARLRFLRRAQAVPGAGMALGADALARLRAAGWFEGRAVRVADLHAAGTVRVLASSLRETALQPARPPTITVMVPARNEEAWIGATLRAVYAQTHPADSVIVIDDGSSDATAEIARAHGARVVRPETRRGRKGAALNAGLPYVGTDAVVVVDADTTLHPEALAIFARSLGAGADAASGSVLPLNQRGLWARGRAIEYCVAIAVHKRLQMSYDSLMVLSGCIAGFRTDVLRAIGGFPDRTVGEDMDATWTLHLEGYRLDYLPKAVAYTVEPSTWRLYKGQMRRWSAAFFQTLAVHRAGLRRRPALAFLVGAALWDIATAPIALVAFPALMLAGVVRPNPAMALFSGGFALAAAAIAAWYLGVWRTIRSFPGFVALALLNPYFFVESLVREWFLHRSQTVWARGH